MHMHMISCPTRIKNLEWTVNIHIDIDIVGTLCHLGQDILTGESGAVLVRAGK